MNDVVKPEHLNEKHDPENSSVHPMLVDAFKSLLNYLARDNDLTDSERANFADTAVRAAKAFANLTATRTEITASIKEILATGFPMEHTNNKPGAITQGPIRVHSYCPHHMLPVLYDVFVSYMPLQGGHVLGLSKLSRIAKELGRRPVLQEQLAADIADVLHVQSSEDGDQKSPRWPGIKTTGSAVVLTGKHSCMTCRGVHSDALTSVTELRGAFWEGDHEAKLIQSIEHISRSTLRG